MKKETITGIKGAGEMASAAAWRLYMANIPNIFMMETPAPLAVRRKVSFCEALYNGTQTIENVTAEAVKNAQQIKTAWDKGNIAVIADPYWNILNEIKPDLLIDAVLAKKNLGTKISDAPLVLGLGPGFTAGIDVHIVIETNRGHNLGRIITDGKAEPNTGIPGNIDGFSIERVLKSPCEGVFNSALCIGSMVKKGETVGKVGAIDIHAQIAGVLRGLIKNGTRVSENMKVGDIDPRGKIEYCYTISDKARAISGSVLEAVLR